VVGRAARWTVEILCQELGEEVYAPGVKT
jgi:hypothetical protein